MVRKHYGVVFQNTDVSLISGSCETYEQEKIVCHYHDCMRGTIEKPDYRLVEDKLYFDYSMKFNYSDEENSDNEDYQAKELDLKTRELIGTTSAELGPGLKGKVAETLQLGRKKSKAMVINHHIYF